MVFLIFIATFVAVACLGLPLAILAAFAVLRSPGAPARGDLAAHGGQSVGDEPPPPVSPPPAVESADRSDRIGAWRV